MSDPTAPDAPRRGAFKRLYHGETNYDIVGRWKVWFGVSGAILLIGVVTVVTQGLNLGIDFTGGTVWQVEAGKAEVADVQTAMADLGYEDVQVQEVTQVSGGQNTRFLRVEAEAAATQAKGLAEGEAVRAKGLATAEAIKARAEALAENQDAVIGQQLAENWPAIVEAAAKPFGDVDQMILLNGAQGLSDVLAQALSQGVTGLQMARSLLAGGSAPTKDATGSGAGGSTPTIGSDTDQKADATA